MPELIIPNLNPSTLDRLRRRAEASGRSLQAEAELILDSVARAEEDDDAARARADQIFAELADREHPDSAELIRQIRDR